ncbi:MAG: GNAT family N-acetyltransferase [Brachymonas sp.]|nr:GNAT family N-acetyltransferase [Brachymonas sp.]
MEKSCRDGVIGAGGIVVPPVVYQRGFPDALRAQAAELYDAVFGQKLALAIPCREKRLQLLAASFRPDHCFVAMQGDALVGIAGFKSAQGAFTGGMNFDALVHHVGHVGAWRAAVVLSIYDPPLRRRQLLLDRIVVADSARGQGIGSQLLEIIKNHAAHTGCRRVRLYVIDTNHTAKRLYKRHGFRQTATINLMLLRWLLGFSRNLTMEFFIPRKARQVRPVRIYS